jgi:hypothetical protein
MAERFSHNNVIIGKVCELHQQVGDKVDTITTRQGVPINNNQNSLRDILFTYATEISDFSRR